MMTRWGGFLDELEEFDAAFFGISPREAATLDPTQRLLLETTWEACEDATIDPHTLAGEPVGVFVGQWLSDFESRLFADTDQVDFHATTGSGRYASSGRLSFVLGAIGPSMTVDTACSSSLVAVHLACQSLRTGESTVAIAGRRQRDPPAAHQHRLLAERDDGARRPLQVRRRQRRRLRAQRGRGVVAAQAARRRRSPTAIRSAP